MDNQNPLDNMSEEDLQKLKKAFQDKMFADLGLEKLPEDEKKSFLQKLSQKVNESILNTLIVNLDEVQVNDLDKQMEIAQNDEERARIFLESAKNIPDIKKKITDALQELYQQMIKLSKKFDEEHPPKE
ncbi:MAG: hypothetical protein ABH837_02430, partial [bacterium]